MKATIDASMMLGLAALISVTLFAGAASPLSAAQDDIPRTASGRPDLSGTYDIKTLTPLERPRQFGDSLYLTPEQAEEIEENERLNIAKGAAQSDPDRAAPVVGGGPPVGLEEGANDFGSGGTGGYNNFWIDRGDSVIEVDGRFRTSILTDPPNGRRPMPTPEVIKRFQALRASFGSDDGTAYWLEWKDRPGPFDNPEQRGLNERCLASFSSTVPALPSLYNNYKRIVQTDDEVMILNEMVHDVRVVRLDSEHPPAEITFWHGDSIGRWEGDTLVVDTTNFKPSTVFGGNSATLHVVERFTRRDADTLHYEFTVKDPSVWTASWTGDLIWPAADGKLYEYACHEGNYALGGILRGARLLEKEAMEKKDGN